MQIPYNSDYNCITVHMEKKEILLWDVYLYNIFIEYFITNTVFKFMNLKPLNSEIFIF